MREITLWPCGDPQPLNGMTVLIINVALKLRVNLLVPTPYRTSKEASKHFEASKCKENLNVWALNPGEAPKTKF